MSRPAVSRRNGCGLLRADARQCTAALRTGIDSHLGTWYCKV